MTRLTAETLDFSRFPAPLAIKGIDYEVLMKQRKTRLVELFQAIGIEFDVASLASDPAIIHAEDDAYQELLAYGEINDAVKAVMPAFARGADLDHMAARFGVVRRIITAATDSAPAVIEGDAEFRRRTLLAPEAWAAAGPIGAYAYHALTADTRVINADIWSPGPGKVSVALQARQGGGIAPSEVVEAVRAYLARPDIKPLTDMVTVRSVYTVPYSIELIAYVRPGPDQLAVKAAIEASVGAMVAARRMPARDIPRSAIIAAATVGPVDRVQLLSPVADLVIGNGDLAVCLSINVQVLEHEG
ncbi:MULTISPECIES: baseplate assembly protein [unclassified Shinella]|uniref:baseplate assembly protein n=1 Tax=unclassified Shinella TaxID=2643062 RepID=UPI00234EBF2C|nr:MULTISPECIES: baseplate J/gp47 family protein [unclassified Shinella]MCO5153381.1 baseplate J/gp47 family protein [Shinella sp.]MDC7260560.1 baseplate J/gp47 family protein [Shinella sp. HY16]MDC7267455.1 baseplate J/gp47 family protein [Shinella sp. YZ44]